jgi:ketosteroid isomerase-like protein
MGFGPAKADHRDAVIYRRTAEAFRSRDLKSVADGIHDDVAWHFPGRSWLAGEIRGREALLGYLRELVRRTANTFLLEDLHIAGTDHHLVALQRFGATIAGETQRFEATSVMRYEGGRQIERWFYLADLPAFEQFFSKFDGREVS